MAQLYEFPAVTQNRLTFWHEKKSKNFEFLDMKILLCLFLIVRWIKETEIKCIKILQTISENYVKNLHVCTVYNRIGMG